MKQVQKDNYQMVQKGQIVRAKGPNDKRGTSNFCTGEFMAVREWYLYFVFHYIRVLENRKIFKVLSAGRPLLV